MHIFILLLNELSTARPQDTQSLGDRTLEIHSFELVPETLEIRGFLEIHCAFYVDFARIFWVFTNLMMHSFQDTQFFPGTNNCVTFCR